jgi:hypothetical protein
LVNNKVGSLPGPSELERTIVWPFDSKNLRNLSRISDDFMFFGKSGGQLERKYYT